MFPSIYLYRLTNPVPRLNDVVQGAQEKQEHGPGNIQSLVLSPMFAKIVEGDDEQGNVEA